MKGNQKLKLYGLMIVAFLLTAALGAASADTAVTRDEFFHIVDTYSINPAILNYRESMAAYAPTRPEAEIVIDALDYARYETSEGPAAPEILNDYQGMAGAALLTGEDSLVEYDFTVPEEGWYDILIHYYPYEGNHSEIQRALMVDGNLPYGELALVRLQRIWRNGVFEKVTDANNVTVTNWRKDNQGNDLKPSPVESPAWIQARLYDNTGYVMEPLALYLTEGDHTISLLGLREPLLIKEIKLTNEDRPKSYAELMETEQKNASAKQVEIRIEAENADRTSSQMLYPVQDQASSDVYPASSKYLLNNAIGGNSWRLVNQWIEWDFEVPENGYYNITLYDKQNFSRGIDVCRRIYIDGKVPFSEMDAYYFSYEQNWRKDVLQDESGTPFRFYLTKGSHTLRMEVVLGEMSGIISAVQECVLRLNAVYRSVIYITGITPDQFRDYQLERMLPGLEQELIDAQKILHYAIAGMEATAGSNSDKMTVLRTMDDQLTELIKDQELFVEVLSNYRTNVRALGNWINQVLPQPLQIDRIYVHTEDVNPKIQGNDFVSRFAHEMERLYYSFIIDYNSVGNVSTDSEDTTVLTLWIGAGRDQANVIKSLIDEKFTPDTGININLQLVDMGALMRAVLSGQSPDIVIQTGGGENPLNFGLRNAVLDLTQFEDYEEVVSRFPDCAMVPFSFDGATYALPDTLSFPMMFYRKDVLAEIGLEIPKTWDDVKVAMSVLNKNQMEFGMLPGENIYAMLLYQNGGEFYSENGDRSALNSDVAVNTFKKYCEFYSDYRLDKGTSVEERFRTGESPLIIADYTLYNNLQVSAPDIYGLWNFTQVPGTVKEDGSVDYSASCGGNADMIMSATKHPEECWEFLKWWTSAEIQTLYGREMESLMGASARVPTANMEALESLGWPIQDYQALMNQLEMTRGIPQVPGGYFTWRNINNAFYSVVESGAGKDITPREELMDRVYYINAEIDYKRKEFCLPLATDAGKEEQ